MCNEKKKKKLQSNNSNCITLKRNSKFALTSDLRYENSFPPLGWSMNTTSSCLFIPLFFPFTTVKRGIIPFEVGPFPIVFHSTLRCLTERREEERRKESSLSLSPFLSRCINQCTGGKFWNSVFFRGWWRVSEENRVMSWRSPGATGFFVIVLFR